VSGFWKKSAKGYCFYASLVNLCWSYILCGEWRYSFGDLMASLALLAVLVPLTPVIYLVIAPLAALLYAADAPEPGEEDDEQR